MAICFALAASLLMENVFAETAATSKFGYDVIGQDYSMSQAAKTFTLSNYTTPPDTGIIKQISIYLKGIPEGSQVTAVIFANEPDAKYPQGGEPVAQSSDTLNVTSMIGNWYNFTMNYSADQNTVYWLGYYAEKSTQYFFDANNNHLLVTSQPKDGTSDWMPVGWSYNGKSIMSLNASYTTAGPKPTPTPTPTPTHILTSTTESTQSFQDILFVLLIIGAESVIVVTDRNNKKNNAVDKH